MEHTTLLGDLTLLFGAAVLVSYLFRAIRLSTITGFIVAGTLIGPSGFGLIASPDAVRSMEEIGVILLLFSIGIEFSPERIRNMRWAATAGGGGQVLLTGLIVALAALAFGAEARTAIFLAMLGSLSSTVIGLRLLHERGQTMSPEGGVSLAILIFQDMAVLPMILLVPFLTGVSGGGAWEILRTLALSAGAVGLILVIARSLVPRMIALTVRSRSRDQFILSVIVAVVGMAWASTRFGISAGLGAFLAGLVISESEYSHQVLSDVLPFRETFNSLFFVSIGMLLDPEFVLQNALLIGLAAIGLILTKTLITSAVVRLIGFPWRIALSVGLLLAQVGEFSIVLLRTTGGVGPLGSELEQIVLATILVTMVLTPVAVRFAEWARPTPAPGGVEAPPLHDHTLVVGFGLNGRNVSSLLKASGFPFAVLEMNPRTVSRGRREDWPIYYGDAASESVLEWVGAGRARAIVFAISDPAATRGGVAAARRLSASVYILARTRYLSEIEPLYTAGASVVITEEFETSLTIIRRLLDRLGVHPSRIDRTVYGIRQQHYGAFLGADPAVVEVDSAIRMFRTTSGQVSDGRSIASLALRSRTGATIVAIERDDQTLTNPAPDFVLRTGDQVHLIGSEHEVGAAIGLV
jgi:CPA2 family monovalent cation:H+ antiporter-2